MYGMWTISVPLTAFFWRLAVRRRSGAIRRTACWLIHHLDRFVPWRMAGALDQIMRALAIVHNGPCSGMPITLENFAAASKIDPANHFVGFPPEISSHLTPRLSVGLNFSSSIDITRSLSISTDCSVLIDEMRANRHDGFKDGS
jgi:hypothetical protein